MEVGVCMINKKPITEKNYPPKAGLTARNSQIQTGSKICPCGCGKEFEPKRKWQRFYNTRCRNNYHNRISKEKKSRTQPQITQINKEV